MKKRHLNECTTRYDFKPFIVFKLALLYLLICSFSFEGTGINEAENITQQGFEVRGTVTDIRNEPLVGVNVLIQGTTTGTVTDVNGNYSLRVPDGNAVLQFSYVGHLTQSHKVDDRRLINVSMAEDLAILDEIVVIGYSTRRQSELSSSVSVISEDRLRTAPTSNNLGVMLQGRVPGLIVSNTSGMPGSGSNIVIRGAGSIGASTSPLFVVDGIIGGSYNPQDVETVTILKDAAATGIYGSRAANGVIVITTRTGKPGDFKVSVSSTTGPTFNWDDRVEVHNAASLYEQQVKGMRNLYDLRVSEGHPSFTGTTFEAYRDNILPPEAKNTDTDWYGLLNRTGFLNRTQVAMSGGNERTTFYVSGNYNHEKATMIDRQYTQATLRSNVNHKIFDNLSANLRITGQYNEDPNYWFGNRPRWESFSAVPYDNPYMVDGLKGHLSPVMDPNIVPLWYHYTRQNYILERETSEVMEKNFGGNVGAQVDWGITDWLRVNTNTRVSGSFRDRNRMHTHDNLIGRTAGGFVTWNFNYGTSIITSNTMHTTHRFGNHSIFGILGQEYSYNNSRFTEGTGYGVVAGMTALGSTGTANNVSGTLSETGFKSYFGQLDYNYLSKYFLVGSLRRDASSRFGPNHKWATFYSAGANWLVSREDFLLGVDWLDLLKFRLSYGKTGNANISDYLHMGTYQFTDRTAYDGNAGALPSRLPNTLLSWESAHTTNFGVELAIFQRATIELDLYRTINTDLLQSVPLPAASGFASQQRNVGSVRNQGIDLNITTVNVDGLLRWHTNLNVNFNRNKVLELAGGADIFPTQRIIREGLPLMYFYMREWAGVDPQTGMPLWTRWEDENGGLLHGRDTQEPFKVTTTSGYSDASLIPVGSAYPDFTGGFTNDLFYRNISLTVLTNFAYGQKIYNSANYTVHDLGSNRLKVTKWQGWTTWEKPGDQADLPQLLFTDPYNSRNASTIHLFDASYLRIQSVQLGYSFPRSVARLRNLHVSAAVENLAIITNFPYGDSDTSFESPLADLERYRPTRKFLFTIRFDI
jgi:TonB-linked SusC/RagA family outer membrane protein